MAARGQQARRAKRRDGTRARPLSLDALRTYGALKGLAPPQDAFDPAGTWRHIYRLWLVGNGASQYRGFIEVGRGTPATDGTVNLDVQRTLVLGHHPAIHTTTARLKCAADALCTPRSWQIEAQTLTVDMKPFARSRVAESASVRGQTITITRGKRRLERCVPTPFTSDFSLFDAVQRLCMEKTQPMGFALLQDLDQIKAGQRLSYRERIRFEVGGKELALSCYQQIGRGILPYRYYVDAQGRLLIAISGIRAYIFDPEVHQWHEKVTKWLAKRSRK